MVLATQNPVDLDYKAMSNAGTWMIGRLQTDHDKARVLDGLKSAAGGADLAALDAAIGGLGKRQFMLVSAKAAPAGRVRHALGDVVPARAADARPGRAAHARRARARAGVRPGPATATPRPVAPAVAAGVAVGYLDAAAPWAAQVGASAGGRLRAYLAARVSIRFDDAKAQVDELEEFEALYGPLDEGFDLERETVVDFDDRDFAAPAPAAARLRAARPSRSPRRRSSATPSGRSRAGCARRRRSSCTATPSSSSSRGPERRSRRSRSAATRRLKPPRTPRRRRSATASKRARTGWSPRWPRRSAASRSSRWTSAPASRTRWPRARERSSARCSAAAGARARSRARSAASRHAAGPRPARQQRRRTAEAKAADVQDDLLELEQEILDEVQEIDAKWREIALTLDTVTIRPEAADVRVQRLTLVWIPSS